MFKFEREGKMPIIFDDDSQMFFNTGFIKKKIKCSIRKAT